MTKGSSKGKEKYEFSNKNEEASIDFSVDYPDNPTPLSWEEVEKLQQVFGSNQIEALKPRSWWKILFHALTHPFNFVLAALAIIAGATQDFETMAVMFVMVFLSTILRFVQELKSEVAASALKNLVQNKATVIRVYKVPDDRDPTFQDIAKMDAREPVEFEIPIQEIVPGDIIKLSAGDMVPGDIHIMESKDLFISQSALTGEAMPAEKHALSAKDIAKYTELERPDLCFMGTSVTSGTAKAVIIKIGSSTLFGQLAKNLAKTRTTNAFQSGIKRISYMFLVIMGIMLPSVLIIEGFGTGDWVQALLFAVAVAVGLTPEMLPMIVNGTLAKGALTMSKKKTIVKNLDSIVNFGSMDLLCTDKTGTLTQNKVVLMKHLDLTGKNSEKTLEMAFLNSHFQTGLKNLLDCSVINYYNEHNAESKLADLHTKVDEVPFDFVRKRISVVLRNNVTGEHILVSKGAMEETISICTRVESNGVICDFAVDIKQQAQLLGEELNRDGLRTVAVAYKTLTEVPQELTVEKEHGEIFVGFIAFLDPPKESTAPAIAELISKGITIKVLTGDTPVVCKKVCDEVKLPVTGIVTTAEIKDLDEDQLAKVAEEATIFAKLTPLEKAKLVKVLKRKHVVGFLGDGINDAAALREADVGVSVDDAVDVAKESADIILLEKSLLVLAKGVILGRVTYGNTIKYMKMAISSNFGNVFSVLVASIWLPFLPMLPIHLVVQNLLYDFSQIAIPWDRMDPDYLVAPCKWSIRSIITYMFFLGPLSSVFDITTFIFMYYYFGWNKPDLQVHFQTGWFVEGLLTQTLIIHMIRTAKIPIIQSTASWPVIVGTAIVMALGVAIPFSPIKDFVKMVPLPGMYFPYLLGALIGYCLLSQIVKLLYIKLFKVWL